MKLFWLKPLPTDNWFAKKYLEAYGTVEGRSFFDAGWMPPMDPRAPTLTEEQIAEQCAAYSRKKADAIREKFLMSRENWCPVFWATMLALVTYFPFVKPWRKIQEPALRTFGTLAAAIIVALVSYVAVGFVRTLPARYASYLIEQEIAKADATTAKLRQRLANYQWELERPERERRRRAYELAWAEEARQRAKGEKEQIALNAVYEKERLKEARLREAACLADPACLKKKQADLNDWAASSEMIRLRRQSEFWYETAPSFFKEAGVALAILAALIAGVMILSYIDLLLELFLAGITYVLFVLPDGSDRRGARLFVLIRDGFLLTGYLAWLVITAPVRWTFWGAMKIVGFFGEIFAFVLPVLVARAKGLCPPLIVERREPTP